MARPKTRSPKTRGSKALTEAQQRWIVCRFACHGRLGEVMAEFEQEFGKPITTTTLRNYDMRNIRDAEHAKERGVAKWYPVFKDAQKEYAASIANIPIADATYRLTKIDEMFALAWDRRNFKMAKDLLEQAAKETGGAFSNRRQVEGTVEHNHHHEEVPIDAQRSVIAEKIGEALAAMMAGTPPQTDTAKTKH